MPKDTHILDALYDLVESRKSADPDESYTARLYQKGTGKICQKVGEEASEVIVDALQLKYGQADKSGLAEESADLLYHLLVLWADQGLAPEDVWDVLDARFLKKTKGETE